MRILLSILLFFSLQAESQIIRANPFYRPFASGCSYLLDQYSEAAAAYSLRKLDVDYAGSAIRVRRSSDNTEQDIGFIGSCGDLDTASLKTFVGTGGSDDGFVVTWYSQTGSNNVTQSTAGNQPLIVDNGVVQRQNGKPSILFVAASSNYLTGGDILDLSELYLNAFSTVKLGSAANQTPFGKSKAGSESGRWSLLKDAGNLISLMQTASGVVAASVAYSNTDYSLFEVYINKSSDTNQLKKNNSQIAVNTGAQDNAATNTTNSFFIGVYQDASGVAPLSGYYLNGNIGELIVYRKLWNSTERTAIINNINSYYTIY